MVRPLCGAGTKRDDASRGKISWSLAATHGAAPLPPFCMKENFR
jgi:hypothetical protein